MLAALVLSATLAAAPDAAARQPSLLSAEPLRDGGSALLVSAGLPFLQATWLQGVKENLDAGAQVEFDWLSTEIFAGGAVRRGAGRQGPFDLALRGRAGVYGDFGAHWAVDGNRDDTGIQVAPGAVASLRVDRGVLAFSFDLPLTITFERGGGFIAQPRVATSFETPLFGELSAGARLGAFWHVAAGGAPMEDDPRASVDFAGLLTWRAF
jgi:hypothetical protein